MFGFGSLLRRLTLRCINISLHIKLSMKVKDAITENINGTYADRLVVFRSIAQCFVDLKPDISDFFQNSKNILQHI